MSPTTPRGKDWRERISIDPAVCHGQACVAGTRVLVTVVLDSLGEGLTRAEIVREYPSITHADVRACVEYSTEMDDVAAIHARASEPTRPFSSFAKQLRRRGRP
jgi:uncharacterized protein (DUF433 family)